MLNVVLVLETLINYAPKWLKINDFPQGSLFRERRVGGASFFELSHFDPIKEPDCPQGFFDN